MVDEIFEKYHKLS